MSKSRFCYSPTPLDKKVSELSNGAWSPQVVAFIRGAFDEHYPNAHINENINAQECLDKLVAFDRYNAEQTAKKIHSGNMKPSKVFAKLKQTFRGRNSVKLDRINMIVSDFTNMLSDEVERSGESRTEVCKSRQFTIFERVHKLYRNNYCQLKDALKKIEKLKELDPNTLTPKQRKAIENISEYQHRVDALEEVLDNWEALASAARVVLKGSEKLKLGNFNEYAEEAYEDDFSESELAELYDPENSTKEAYQEINELTSSYARMGEFTRRLLSRCYLRNEDGSYDKDDLGQRRRMNPVTAHQFLMDNIYHAVDSEDMMRILEQLQTEVSWVQDLYAALKENPEAQTKFWNDFYKDALQYSEANFERRNGTFNIKVAIKNGFRKRTVSKFLSGLKFSRKQDTSGKVFNEKDEINWRRFAEVRSMVQKYMSAPQESENAFQPRTRRRIFDSNITFDERTDIFYEVLSSLGFNVSKTAIKQLITSNNKNGADRLASHIEKLFTDGFDSILKLDNNVNVENIEEFMRTKSLVRNKDNNALYEPLLKRKTGRGDTQVAFIEKQLDKILKDLSSNDALQRERAATYKNDKGKTVTFFTHVLPSFLGTFAKRINSYANNNTKLKKYLDNKYGSCSIFKENGVWLNPMLRELYESNPNDPKSFANTFSVTRLLGASEHPFENFTDTQHLSVMVSQFLFDQTHMKDKAGNVFTTYPVFVLGDSGVCKTIVSKRYSINDIVEEMYNLYKSDVRTMALNRAATEKLTKDGYKPFENFSEKGTTFTLLPFLNGRVEIIPPQIEGYYDAEQTRPSYSDEKIKIDGVVVDKANEKAEIKRLIKEQLDKDFEEFKKDTVRLGLYDKSGSQFKFFNKEIEKFKREHNLQDSTNEEVLDILMKDFYCNTRLATMCQIQVLTVNPGFYRDIEDLQKRYKEQHAPGWCLDVKAKDPYSENGKSYVFRDANLRDNIAPTRTCVYFDELETDAEETNPEFMRAIEANKPEFERRYGKNAYSKMLEDYKKNALTDGQGYVTLDNYRQIMIAGGRWTKEMQDTYDEVRQLRAKYYNEQTKDFNEIPTEEIQKIADMAVVFQPLKPFTFTFEKYSVNNGNELLVPVQHKYSEMVLIPELMRPSRLRDIALTMEDKGIDMLCSTKCVKVGNFGATSLKDISSREDLDSRLSKDTAYYHKINYEDYKIQTNVPNHGNEDRLFGTQVRKLIMANVKAASERYFHYANDGKPINLGPLGMCTLNGRNLINFYNELIVANMMESWEEFEKEIDNPEKLQEILQQCVINNDRESWDNFYAYVIDDINGEKQFHVPLSEGGNASDSAALLFSLFRKAVNKQKIRGGSAVQASAMGSTLEESGDLSYVCADADGNIIRVTDANYEQNKNLISNILYAEVEVPFDLSYIVDGEEIPLKFEDYCDSNGNLLKNEDGTTKIETDFPGILDRVCYRIPTEKPYSMINAKVVRFTPPSVGGVIKVPSQGTTIAGFDFDIDKLYFMMKEFVYNTNIEAPSLEEDYINSNGEKVYDESGNPISKKLAIWNALYDTYGDIKEELKKARDRVGGKQPLHTYWKEAKIPENKNALFASVAEGLGVDLKNRETRIQTSEYDFSKPPTENSRAARNNMLIQLIQKRLEDPETFVDRYTPGGAGASKDAARTIRELLNGDISNFTENGRVSFDKLESYLSDKSNYRDKDPKPKTDYSDPMTIIRYNQQNQVAAKLIGIFANQNANHAFASLMKHFGVKKGFAICGHDNFTDLINSPEGRDAGKTMAEYLAASVDAVKDPVLNFLNFNTTTAQSGALLARLGFDSTEIGLFLNQPVIKELCSLIANEKCSLENAIFRLTIKYEKETKNYPYAGDACSKQSLADAILDARTLEQNGQEPSTQFKAQQLEVLRMFEEVSTTAKELNDFVTSTKFTAANSVGSTFGDLYEQQMKCQNYIEKLKNPELTKLDIQVSDTLKSPIYNIDLSGNMDDYFREVICAGGLGNPFAYEQCMYDLNRRCVKLLGKYYPYETAPFRSARQLLKTLTKYGIADAATINKLHEELPIYLINEYEKNYIPTSDDDPLEGDFNPDKQIEITDDIRDLAEDSNDYALKSLIENKTTINQVTFYREVFPKLLAYLAASDENLRDFGIIKYLNIEKLNGRDRIQIAEVGGLKSREKDLIRDSWSDLQEVNPEISKGLFMYCYFNTGYGFNPFSFMHLAPTAVKESFMVGNKTYLQFMQDMNDGKISAESISDFMQKFLMNHTENYRYVYSTSKYNKSKLDSKIFDKAYARGSWQSSFTISSSELKEDNGRKDKSIIISTDKNGTTTFMPVIAVYDNRTDSYFYYMANGPLKENFNLGIGGTITYRRVSLMGETNKSLDYWSDIVVEQDSYEADSESPGDGSTGDVEHGFTYDVENMTADQLSRAIEDRINLDPNLTDEEKRERINILTTTTSIEDLRANLNELIQENNQNRPTDDNNQECCS